MTSKSLCGDCGQILGLNYANCSTCLYAANVAAAWNSGGPAIAKASPDGNSIIVGNAKFTGEIIRFNKPDASGTIIRPDAIRLPSDGDGYTIGVDPGVPGGDRTARVILQRDAQGVVQVTDEDVSPTPWWARWWSRMKGH